MKNVRNARNPIRIPLGFGIMLLLAGFVAGGLYPTEGNAQTKVPPDMPAFLTVRSVSVATGGMGGAQISISSTLEIKRVTFGECLQYKDVWNGKVDSIGRYETTIYKVDCQLITIKP